jgi:hypothetical protein
MSTLRNVRVISEGGRLIGIFAASPRHHGSKSGAPVAQVRAGPGQKEHDIEIEWPAERGPTALTEALHAQARRALGLR